jgi:hypothetical protein
MFFSFSLDDVRIPEITDFQSYNKNLLDFENKNVFKDLSSSNVIFSDKSDSFYPLQFVAQSASNYLNSKGLLLFIEHNKQSIKLQCIDMSNPFDQNRFTEIKMNKSSTWFDTDFENKIRFILLFFADSLKEKSISVFSNDSSFIDIIEKNNVTNLDLIFLKKNDLKNIFKNVKLLESQDSLLKRNSFIFIALIAIYFSNIEITNYFELQKSNLKKQDIPALLDTKDSLLLKLNSLEKEEKNILINFNKKEIAYEN